MLVFKNKIPTIFNIAYKSTFSPAENIDDIILKFERINAEGVTYDFPAEIKGYDCYDRLLEIESTVNLETGEYIVSLWTIGAYSLDYSEDYSRIDDPLAYIAVDNANIQRENDRVVRNNNVVYIE